MIRMIDESEMSTALDAEIRRSLCICFPNDAAVFSQTRQWHGSGPAYSIILQEQGRVVAHVGVLYRKLTVGERWLTVGGVQNVFVLPDCRGRGLVDQVMAASMQEADQRNYDCGLLFCVPELEKVYRRCDWITVDDRKVIRVESGQEVPPPGKNIAMFHPLRVKQFPPGPIHLRGNDW